MAENELKPCPFCGGEAEIYKSNKDFIVDKNVKCYSVYCTRCCCQTQYEKTEQQAREDWNRRANNEIHD